MWDVEQDEQGNWWTVYLDDRYENFGPNGKDAAQASVDYWEDFADSQRYDLDGNTGVYAN